MADAPRNPDFPSSLLLVGAGKMGGAMLEGWLAGGLDPAGVSVLDPNASDDLRARAASRGFALNADMQAIAAPEVMVLGVKPQSLGDVAPGIAHLAKHGTLVVSILAGKTIANLRAALPEAGAVVRTIPNLPASILRGATGAFAEPRTSARQRAVADALLRAIGTVEWVPGEDLIDAVTAVSGSGPAYVFLLAECLAEAGRAAGLEAGLAGRLARATITGAAALLDGSDLPPSTLRENVTSPGGTTAAALGVLMAENGIGTLMREAVAAAARRAGELSG